MYGITIHRITHKQSLDDGGVLKCHVLTEERSDEISERLNIFPRNVSHFTHETRVSKLSAQTRLNFQNEIHHDNSRVRNSYLLGCYIMPNDK